MLARALIVMLLVLNLGVAAWWALQPAPRAAKLKQPQGVAQLQLLSELPRRPPVRRRPAMSTPLPVDATAKTPPQTPTATVAAATVAPPSAADVDPKALHCFSLGPFPTTAAAETARTRLQRQVKNSAVRTRGINPSLGWRVWVPPLESTDAAKAMAKRIADAGFSDYLVLRIGSQANAIALGSYRSEAAAHRRAEGLVAAGFPAQIEPMGDTQAAVWLDIAAAPDFDAGGAQTLVAAPSRQALDCKQMR